MQPGTFDITVETTQTERSFGPFAVLTLRIGAPVNTTARIFACAWFPWCLMVEGWRVSVSRWADEGVW